MTSFEGRELHFIAIGGAGMSGLALVCAQLGARVSGSDRAESTYLERLRAVGLDPIVGHDAANVPAGAEVIVSTAIGADNPELVHARARGQREMHRSELLAELCALKRLIAVAGAHGKTSTAGMVVQMLRGAGADPAFLLGGELPGAGPGGAPANAAWGAGEWIVAEADESDGSFLRLDPEVGVVTNVELDHHSHWRGEGELWAAFERFTSGSDGVVAPAGSRFDSLASSGDSVRFALASSREAESADLVAEPLEPGAAEVRRFALGGPLGAGFESATARLAVPGEHNVANALAAIAACELASTRAPLPARGDLLDALASFPGMSRRLERKGEASGAVIYDDYAHHPTEVAASLTALREDLAPKRLIAVFQPHLYSRTKALARRFGEALAIADEVGVLDIYAARELPEGELAGVSGRDVAVAAAEFGRGRPVLWLENLATAARILEPRLGPGDLLVTIGAGDVFRLADHLVGAEAIG